MSFDAYIFDLDGTLLNTLPDLVRLTNMVLEERGWPMRTREEILSYVGNGGRVLIGRAAPDDAAASDIDDAFSRWRALYPTYGHALTKPYDGIPELLTRLRSDGVRLGVLSNKFDEATKQVIGEHFPGVFDIVRGESADTPRKPDPTGLLRMIDELGATVDTAVLVGDSTTDIATANAADVASIGVTWGYQPRESLVAAGAGRIVESPSEI
jgi:phosphoglycolate phosphatase